MKKLALIIIMGFGVFTSFSQIVVPIEDVSSLSPQLVSHLEIKTANTNHTLLTLSGVNVEDAIQSLPVGNYDIEIVYINNTRKKIEYHTED